VRLELAARSKRQRAQQPERPPVGTPDRRFGLVDLRGGSIARQVTAEPAVEAATDEADG